MRHVRRQWAAPLLAAFALASSPEAGQGQVESSLRIPESLSPVEPEHPLTVARETEDAIRRDSSDLSLRLRAAEAYTLAALLEPDPDRQREVAYAGRTHAMAAVALDSAGVEGRYWWAVSAGIAADREGGRTQVRLAAESWDQAGWVLSADSLHAGAHHVRGRINSSVQRINPFVRFIARVVLGAARLRETSWEAATYHLERAVELDPVVPLFHWDLAMVYCHLDRADDMRRALRDATQAPGRSHPALDEGHRVRAAQTLASGRMDC